MVIRPTEIRAWAFRVPIDTPVTTSFGVMHDRPAVLVQAINADGAEGWGEVWCNFPSVGAEYRARLVAEIVAPILVGHSFDSPQDAFLRASRALEILAIQTGDHGAIAQAVAGVDIALWDLAARRSNEPLYRYLGGSPISGVPAYASGINPDGPGRLAVEKREEGYRAFKLKIGFGEVRDLANLREMRAALGEEAMLMVDANQAWDIGTSILMGRKLEEFGLTWLEEPLRADARREDWRRLAEETPLPLAAGENIRGEDAFADVIDEAVLGVLQPDIGKWGGFSGCLPVARRAIAAGLRFCPHWLGGGIGQVASLHLLGAAGGDGLLEVDSNPNPLRQAMAVPFPPVSNGLMAVSQGPGLGVTPDLKALRMYQTWP